MRATHRLLAFSPASVPDPPQALPSGGRVGAPLGARRAPVPAALRSAVAELTGGGARIQGLELLEVPALPGRPAGPGRTAQAAGPGFRALRARFAPRPRAGEPTRGRAPDHREDDAAEDSRARPAWTGGPTPQAAQRVLDRADPRGAWRIGMLGAAPQAAPGLLVTDVDSTLIGQEVIDELAARAGARERIAGITERAMRGELDFAASLRERVAALTGLPAAVLEQVRTGLVLNPGARELIAHLHEAGAGIGAVSGGFAPILDPLGREIGLDRTAANGLEIEEGPEGPRLTGRVAGPVVDAAAKRERLGAWAGELGVGIEATAALGDGANDLLMVAAAGLGVAYCAKPALDAAAAARIPVPRLDALTLLLAEDAPPRD